MEMYYKHIYDSVLEFTLYKSSISLKLNKTINNFKS